MQKMIIKNESELNNCLLKLKLKNIYKMLTF